MVLSSLFFIFAFLPLVLGGYFSLPPSFRNCWLVLISLIFYAWGQAGSVGLLIILIIANYGFGLMLEQFSRNKTWARLILAGAILFNVGLLTFFKYSNFITKNLNLLLGDVVTATDIILPIGISFFTFSSLAYVIDVYRHTIKAERNLLNVGLYIALFPKLLIGPIVRYDSIAKSLQRSVKFDNFSIGVKRFIVGLGKKVILAGAFAVVADKAFSLTGSTDLSISFAWFGAVAFAFQLYFDFSGYSDMAVGIGRMLGFKFAENFNYPYMAQSAVDFWRRWHISLGLWFRDYVYIPLGGSRVSRYRLIFNLLIVWMLTGIWHGASWSFVVWGLLYFGLISFEKLSGWPGSLKRMTARSLYRIFILFCILIGWVMFRANGLVPAYLYIKSMFGLANNAWHDDLTTLYLHENWLFIICAVIFSMPMITWLSGVFPIQKSNWIVCTLTVVGYFLLFVISISYIVVNGHNPAVYFNF